MPTGDVTKMQPLRFMIEPKGAFLRIQGIIGNVESLPKHAISRKFMMNLLLNSL